MRYYTRVKRAIEQYFLLFLSLFFLFSSTRVAAQCRDENGERVTRTSRISTVRQIRLKSKWRMVLEKRLGYLPAFKDTEKPNAVIILPCYDPQDIYYSYSTIGFIDKCAKVYDLRVAIAAGEQDVFDALEFIPDIEMLFVGGPYLGVVDAKKRTVMLSPKGELSYNDKRFLCYLDHLKEHATIVIYTCFAGTGGEGYNNIANYVDQIVGDRRIIAPRNNLNTCQIEIQQLYPLEVGFVKNGKDMAYRVNL